MPRTTNERLDSLETGLVRVETNLTEFKEEMHVFKGEMYDFKADMTEFKIEMYEFRDEMYDFIDTFNDYATQTELRFQTLERTMAEGFKLVLSQFDLLAYQIKSDFRAVMRDHERTYHGAK